MRPRLPKLKQRPYSSYRPISWAKSNIHRPAPPTKLPSETPQKTNTTFSKSAILGSLTPTTEVTSQPLVHSTQSLSRGVRWTTYQLCPHTHQYTLTNAPLNHTLTDPVPARHARLDSTQFPVQFPPKNCHAPSITSSEPRLDEPLSFRESQRSGNDNCIFGSVGRTTSFHAGYQQSLSQSPTSQLHCNIAVQPTTDHQRRPS